MADDAVFFGMDDARRIRDTVHWFEHSNIIGRPTPQKQQQRGTFPIPVCGILTSNITAASPDGLTGATSFTFKKWMLADDSFDYTPPRLSEEAEETTGVNRSQMTGTAGKFVVCLWVSGSYTPIWVDC